MTVSQIDRPLEGIDILDEQIKTLTALRNSAIAKLEELDPTIIDPDEHSYVPTAKAFAAVGCTLPAPHIIEGTSQRPGIA